ncbi:hypothetical protein JCM9140_1816 [Halalkalibacter wakoensis JCM 9140]|uniref:Uncharacterized protein n=1 Tax=Halalkalibacter wakoensis JCM 9140 TaxID=1236970 RepID=W4Q350_9BACI|nr:hypothetical protein [Halalkalibacter wakoensis]GAE25799.1 hypothetical protein JCM9140_1816 [Halalkalibacter wakoensis JCM 9140]
MFDIILAALTVIVGFAIIYLTPSDTLYWIIPLVVYMGIRYYRRKAVEKDKEKDT